MRNFKLYTLLISFIFLSCGIKVNHDYSISISKTNQYIIRPNSKLIWLSLGLGWTLTQ